MRKKVFVAATRTFPGSFDWIGAALVGHLHDQVTMQTHGRMTIDPFCFCGFGHDCHFQPPVLVADSIPFSDLGARHVKSISYNCLQKKPCSRSYTDGEIYKKVVILGVCLKMVLGARQVL